MEQQILVENETHLDVHITEQPLVSITEPIETELVALSVEQDVKVIQEESSVLLVLTEGGSLYKKAVQDGYSGTELEWMTELLDSKASVQFVVTTMADGNTAYASALLALKAEVGSTYATNVHLSEVIAQRDLARALDKQILESKIDNDIFASNQTMLETMVTADQALSQSLNLLSTNLGSFGSRVSTVEQSITNETSARTLAIQSMSSSFNNRIDAELVTVNQTFVDATGSYATQLQNINTSFNNLLNASINTVNQAITTETQARASQIETLRVDFTSGLSAVISTIQQVQIDIDGNTSAIDLVTGQVNNPSTGLNAAFTRANQAYTLADNTAGAFSIIEGKVNHPTTGLAATYAFAQQVEINANNNTASSINSLRNEITAPNAAWTANNTFIQSIRNDLNNNISTTTTLNSTVADLNTWKTSTASVQLSSLITTTGQLESRAFIGVSSTAGGKATVAGLTISSVDYGLRFKGNIFELVNTSDVQQLYYDTTSNIWKFTGGLVIGGYAINSVNDIRGLDGADGNFVEFRYQENLIQPTTAPTGVNPSGWLLDPPVTTNPIWMVKATKNAANTALVGSWTLPVRFNGLQGNAGTNGQNGKSYAAAQLFSFKGTTTAGFTFSGLTPTTSLTHLNIAGFNSDPQLLTTCSVNGTQYPLIVIRMRNATGSAINNNWQIFYSTNIHGSSESFTKTQLVNLPADGQWYDVIFDMSQLTAGGNDYVTNGIIALRIDPPPGAGYSIDIESIFLGKEGAAVNGDLGAGFYGAVYSDINWTTSIANSRFFDLIGRVPTKFDIFTQTRSDNTDSQSRQYSGTTWEAVALQVNGSIIAQGTIAGNKIISGTEITSPIVTGGRIRTALSGSRTEIHDDGTYLIWTGDGAKTDANATFWIKKNGDGYVKGTFFQGQLMRRRFGSASLPSVTATGHITAGQPVRIDCVGYFRYQFASPSEVENNAGLMSWVIKRNGVTIASGSRQISRIKRDPGGEPGVNWQNIDHVGLNILFVDNSPGSFGTNNSYTFEMTDFGYGTYSTTIATDENLIG